MLTISAAVAVYLLVTRMGPRLIVLDTHIIKWAGNKFNWFKCRQILSWPDTFGRQIFGRRHFTKKVQVKVF